MLYGLALHTDGAKFTSRCSDTGVQAGELLQSHGTALLTSKSLCTWTCSLQLREMLCIGRALPRGTTARLTGIAHHFQRVTKSWLRRSQRIPASTFVCRGVRCHVMCYVMSYIPGSGLAEAGRAGRTLLCAWPLQPLLVVLLWPEAA